MNKPPKIFQEPTNFRQVLECGAPAPLSPLPRRPARLRPLALIQFAWRLFTRRHSPRFAKYQPAIRLGTRKVEQRLLGRLGRSQLETAC